MPVGISFMSLEDFTPQMLENQIARVSQSKRTLRIDKELEIKCKIARVVSGSGLTANSEINNLFHVKRCVKRIKSDDNYCAVRALLVAKHYADKDVRHMNNFRARDRVENEVRKTIYDLGIKDSSQGLSDIAKVESYLKHYQVTVYDENSRFSGPQQPIYCGPQANKFLYLLFYKKHFWPITSARAFFGKRAFCDWCKTATDRLEFHQCSLICALCKRGECKQEPVQYKTCPHCEFNCYNPTCMQIHTSKYCKPRIICEKCGVKYVFKHSCSVEDRQWCVNCKVKVTLDHRCFMQKGTLKNIKDTEGYIFFDYESSQETSLHIPVLVIAHKYNRLGMLEEKKYFYDDGDDVNTRFCEWLFTHKKYLAIAHNLKGYDGVFVMNYLLNNITPGTEPPAVLNQGNKILSLLYNEVRLVDSYLFMPMPLSEFSSTFGLVESKGYFPHLFNTKNNQDYIGPMPPLESYGARNMSKEKRDKLTVWYEQNKNELFNFKEQLFSYCESDVDVLAKGCLAFRRIIIESTGIEPFIQCITLASLCHTIYRHNYMMPDSIGIIPEIGYNPNENTSRKAQLWLRYVATTQNISIQHAKNGGEYVIAPYKLDGYHNGVGYEFHGCLYHGCQKCFSPRTYNPVRQETMKATHRQHCERIEYIKQRVPRLVEMWECDWDGLVKSDERLRKFVKEQELREGINPRDALFGGRTNAAKLHHLARDDERIEYIDVCSLYPYVMIEHEYPVGHPRIITENFQEVTNYFGLVSCRVLPPRKLYFPVLPVKMHNKLLFPLCRTCAQELNTQNNCTHNDMERCIEGVWCTPELHTALDYEYKIIKVFEVWHWENRSKELFASYIKNFLKIKQESSGYPDWAKTAAQRQEYIDKYLDGENIQLDAKKISKNNGLRKIAKLLLNTLWGRFGMNLNRSRIKFVTSRLEWYEMLADENCVIHDVQQANPEILMVVYSERDDMHLGGHQTNVPLAAFVTTYARLKLFKTLVTLDKRVLYFDTDSIIFVSDSKFKSSPDYPRLGDFLGDWTDETDNRRIIEFVSCGAKNYALFYDDGTFECVVKGIQQSCLTSERLNFETIKEVLLYDQTRTIHVPQSKIRIKRKGWRLETVEMEKEYHMVYDKRVLGIDFYTYPYGY